MPVISMFYGVIVMMYFFDDKQHHEPHIHVEYGEESAVLAIPSGEVLKGSVRASRLNLRPRAIGRSMSLTRSSASRPALAIVVMARFRYPPQWAGETRRLLASGVSSPSTGTSSSTGSTTATRST